MPSLNSEPPQSPRPDRVYEQLDSGKTDVDTAEDMFAERRNEISLKAGRFVLNKGVATKEEVEMRRLFYDLGTGPYSYLFGLWEPRQKDDPRAFGDDYDVQKPLGIPAMATFTPVNYSSFRRRLVGWFGVELKEYKRYDIVVTRLRV